MLMACTPASRGGTPVGQLSNTTLHLTSRQFSNNCYDDFCSTHLNDRSNCVVQSIHTVSVPRIVRSKYKFTQDLEKSDRD